MPSVPAYIRNSDWDAYMKVRAKGKTAWAEFIHNALNGEASLISTLSPKHHHMWVEDKKGDMVDFHAPKPIKIPKVYTSDPNIESVNGIKAETFKPTPKVIKQPQDIPPLQRDDPQWEGPILKSKKKGK